MNLRLLLPILAPLSACGAGGHVLLPIPSFDESAITLRANPAMAVGALVEVRVPIDGVAVEVEFGESKEYGGTTGRLAAPAGGDITIPITGLPADARCYARVTVYGSKGEAIRRTDGLVVTTSALPFEMPTLQVTHGASTRGHIALTIFDAGGPDDPSSRSFAVIIDRAGRVLWYRRPEQGSAVVYFDTLPSGRLGMYEGPPPIKPYPGSPRSRLVEVDLSGRPLRAWTAPVSGSYATGMDFEVAASGEIAMLTTSIRSTDGVPWSGGLADGVDVAVEMIDEVSPDGELLAHWESWPAIRPAESYQEWSPRETFGLHANSLQRLATGQYLVSFHGTYSVMRIDARAGEILWRLGGKDSSFHFVNDPRGGFSKQHDARILPNGHLLLLDNGDGEAQTSRVVEYALDAQAKTATLVWSHEAPAGIIAGAAGSARRLESGNTLICYGSAGVIEEVTPAGEVVFAARGPNFLYRGLPVPDFY